VRLGESIAVWDAIRYVSSGLALIAFLASVAAYIYRARLRNQVALIKIAATTDRAALLVEQTLEFFKVDTSRLTKEQQYDLALRQIAAKSQRFLVTASIILLVAVIFSAVAIYSIYKIPEGALNESSILDQSYLPPKVGSFNYKYKDDILESIFIKDENAGLREVPVVFIVNGQLDKLKNHYGIFFDLTNVSRTDLRIVSFSFKTMRWSPLPKIEFYRSFAGYRKIKDYFSMIGKKLQEYPCNLEREDEFVALSPGGLDTFRVAIAAQAEGIYDGELILDYSVGGTVNRMVVGNVTDLYFVDIKNARAAPPYGDGYLPSYPEPAGVSDQKPRF